MALFESIHPLGQDMEVITSALIAGMADEKDAAPEHLKLNYEDPLKEGADGIATLRFADWRLENQGVIYVPMMIDQEDATWKASCEDGLARVSARILVRDMLGRGFHFSVQGQKKLSSYLQFDVLPEGVVFSTQPVGEDVVSQYGGFEGPTYDVLSAYAKRVSSLSTIVELATRY